MINDISVLHNELTSVGLSISGCDSNGNVQIAQRPTAPLINGEPDPNWVDPTDNLVALVLAAHEQTLSSTACVALQAKLTADQWLAYQEARNAPVKQARQSKYQQTCDPIILAALETSLKTATATNGEVTVILPETDVISWINAKNAVRAEYPYQS